MSRPLPAFVLICLPAVKLLLSPSACCKHSPDDFLSCTTSVTSDTKMATASCESSSSSSSPWLYLQSGQHSAWDVLSSSHVVLVIPAAVLLLSNSSVGCSPLLKQSACLNSHRTQHKASCLCCSWDATGSKDGLKKQTRAEPDRWSCSSSLLLSLETVPPPAPQVTSCLWLPENHLIPVK